MSIGYRGKTTNAPRENVAAQAQAERETMWGEITGTITSFDPVTQTASVKPDYRPRHNGTSIEMPELLEVPVRFPRAGGFVITSPVKAGDKVALRPQMRSTESFHTGGDYTSDQDTRTFSLSDMEAFLDGGEPLTNAIPSFNSDNFEIRTADGSFGIELSPTGQFKIKGEGGELLALLASLLDLLSTDALQINYGSSAGTGHQLQFRDQYAEIAAKIRGMTL